MSTEVSRGSVGRGKLTGLAVPRVAVPLVGIALTLLLQFTLLLEKPFNWDEYLHYSKVYQLQDGTLHTPFQTLLPRLVAWSAQVPGDLVDRMLAARMMVWLIFAIGLPAVYSLARRFGEREDALWAVLAYCASGCVFAHGFAIRTDPIAMTLLMVSLALLANRQVSFRNSLIIGALIGTAGVLTVKSVFYAPCFAGLAWLRLTEAKYSRACVYRLAAILPVAVISYGIVLAAHRTGLASGSSTPASLSGFATNGIQWLTQGLFPQARYTLAGLMMAPVYVLALAHLPQLRQSPGLTPAKAAALVCLCLPLVTLLFYRNTFPYFFVFILAPVAAALPPVLRVLKQRYGRVMLTGLMLAPALVSFVSQPRDELARQRAVIEYAHGQLDEGMESFDYAGLVADRPQTLWHLASGIGLSNYRARGVPLVARAIEEGRLGVVIANKPVIAQALQGEVTADGLLPEDVAALHGHFAHVGGLVWLPGHTIPSGRQAYRFEVLVPAAYVASATVTVDGRQLERGERIDLARGQHEASGERLNEVVMWRGTKIPPPLPADAFGPMFTQF